MGGLKWEQVYFDSIIVVQSSQICLNVMFTNNLAQEKIREEMMTTSIKSTATAKGRKDDVAVVVPYAIDVIPDENMKLSGDAAHEDEKLINSNRKDDKERIVVPLTFIQKWGTTIMACCVGMLREYA